MSVALTGGTGFLGLHLLRELLAEHGSLIVLARGEPAAVLDRVGRFLTVAGDPPGSAAELAARVRVVPADVTRPCFGLPAGAFAELAADVDSLWHSAGNTAQDGSLDQLRRVNVEGTRTALELVGAGAPGSMLYHVSTAFVAGRRRYGTVYDDELSDAYGFETPYEQSKYEAEVLVQAWAGERGRSAVIFRPSILTTDLPPDPCLPPHPLLFAAQALQNLNAAAERAGHRPPGARPAVRIAGHPEAHVNVMPVADAAAVMRQLARCRPRGQVDTYHVVHGHELPVSVFLQALEAAVPLRFVLVPEVTDPTPLEGMLQSLSGALRYAHHRRRYDDARVRMTTSMPPRGPLGLDYLRAGIRAAHPR